MAEKEAKKPIEEKKQEKEIKKPEKEDAQKKQESKPAVAKEKKSKKKQEEKIELEREYIIPLRKSTKKVPRYKRAKKAVKTIKEFLAKHMKVEERDIRKVKVDIYLNNEIWFRGIKKPPAKIKVRAVKKGGIVYAELAEIPEKVKYDIARHKKIKTAEIKKPKESKKEKEKKEESIEEKEKERATVEAGLEKQKEAVKELKHMVKGQHAPKTMPQRKALKR